MATRLSSNIKRAITQQALDHRFAKEQGCIKKAWEILALEVYNDVYPLPMRKRMQALPDGAFIKRSSIDIAVGTENYLRLELKEAKPHFHSKRGCVKVYEESSHIGAHVIALQKRESDLRRLMNETRSMIEATLEPLRTLEAVHKLWPESKQFTKDITPAAGALPAIPIETLNVALGLKKAA